VRTGEFSLACAAIGAVTKLAIAIAVRSLDVFIGAS